MPKSQLRKAISYTLNQWQKLIEYVNDGQLNIDNNRAERAIKPFVIGRKNWLFSYTKNGATASAILYSLIETAKANGIIPSLLGNVGILSFTLKGIKTEFTRQGAVIVPSGEFKKLHFQVDWVYAL